MKINKITDSFVINEAPPIYSTEQIHSLDKMVYAIYEIPSFNGATCYMTEYDSDVDVAFGLVIDNKIYWGYFSINNLKNIGGECVYNFDLPLTFRQIRNRNFINNINEKEVKDFFSRQSKIAVRLYDMFVILEEEILKINSYFPTSDFVYYDNKIFRLYEVDILEEQNIINYMLKNYPPFKLISKYKR